MKIMKWITSIIKYMEFDRLSHRIREFTTTLTVLNNCKHVKIILTVLILQNQKKGINSENNLKIINN